MFAGRYRPLREEDEHLDNYDVDYDLGPDDGYLSFEGKYNILLLSSLHIPNVRTMYYFVQS